MARECICCAFLFAFFCPPLAVLCMDGCGVQFCLSLLLTALFWIPGVIHALYVTCKSEPEPNVVIFRA